MITREMILEELNNRNLKYGEYETTLIVDYLLNLYDLNLLPENITYKDLIAKLEKYNVKNIVFFDENHEVNQKWGHKFKGATHTEDNGNITIYVRDSLIDKEIYFFHELTHLFQKRVNKTGLNYDYSGLTDDNGYGTMFNEVATQTLAEKIYNNKYGLKSEFLVFDSGNDKIRLLPGYEIVSDLKNYQMYDYIISLLLDSIHLTKEDLIKEAFNTEYKFMDILEEKTMKLSWIRFDDLKFILEYIFCVDNVFYTNPEYKEKLVNGENVDWEHLDYLFINEGALNRNTQFHFYQTICDRLKIELQQNNEIRNKIKEKKGLGIMEEKNNIYDYGEPRCVLKDEMESILNGIEQNVETNRDVLINYNGIIIYPNCMMKMGNDGVIKKFSSEEHLEILHLLKEDIKNGAVVLTEEQLHIVNELENNLNSNLEDEKQHLL